MSNWAIDVVLFFCVLTFAMCSVLAKAKRWPVMMKCPPEKEASMNRFSRVAATTATVLLAVILGGSAQAAQNSNASISVTPSTISPGGTIDTACVSLVCTPNVACH